jgi:Uma2 family endonuclease
MSILTSENRESATGSFVPAVHRFTVEEYHRLAEAGCFVNSKRVELLDGWIVDMNPIGPPHSFVVYQADDVLSSLAPTGWAVFSQRPITLATSEPEPDVVVARGTPADYKRRHPGPADIGLVVEVADSSLAVDRTQKIPIYAAAMIPCYWIINLIDRQVEVHSQPQLSHSGELPTYGQRRVIDESGSLALTLDGREVGSLRVVELFP